MNLIIDIGNTFAKLAVFNQKELQHKKTVETKTVLEHVLHLKMKFPSLKQAIMSSVGSIERSEINAIGDIIELLVLDRNTPLPFLNHYKTPDTLGVDRMALVCAAVSEFPNKDALIIDAGTCITYDFITQKHEYLGGAISPGLRMRYKSLNNLTANLPLLKSENPKHIIGRTTNEAIHSGVVFGIIKEIDGVIEAYMQEYSDLTVILTGGDAYFLSKQLKSSIFADSNFLLEGLNHILQFNSNE